MAAIDSIIYLGSSATLSPATPEAGDPISVRAFDPPYGAHLLSAWMTPSNSSLSALTAEIKSPRLHDAVHAIHLQQAATPGVPVLQGLPLLPFHRTPQRIESQDTWEVDLQGRAGAQKMPS